MRPDDREFREMTDDELEEEWQSIEKASAAGLGSFHVVRALYVLRERIRRLEARQEGD